MDSWDIAADGIAARIKAHGAELCSLRAPDELLWQAGPAWPRHAPVLFPIVGRLKADTLRHDGKTYPLTQHGFARDRVFTWTERSPARARLTLTEDDKTLASYPFPFRLDITYDVAECSLTQTFAVRNTGEAPLPASFGAHPAFVWPLRKGVAKDAHTLTFGADEPAPIRRLAGGLMLPETVPTPIEGRVLKLTEALFAHDALVLDQPVSHSVRYTAPGAPAIEVAWQGMPQLGIWTKPGDFLCIEPWHGFASPVDFDGDFGSKPGVAIIPPGQTAIGTLIITISSNPD